MSVAALDFTCGSPFTRSLAEFDPTVSTQNLRQIRTVPECDPASIDFAVFFRHTLTLRVLAYDLLSNTWSDVTAMRHWDVPQLIYNNDPFGYITPRLR
jgi:hypothetical protein